MGKIAVAAILVFVAVTLALDIFAMDGVFISSIKDGMNALAEEISSIFSSL